MYIVVNVIPNTNRRWSKNRLIPSNRQYHLGRENYNDNP